MQKLILPILLGVVIATSATAQISIAPELGLNISDMAMKVTNLASGSFNYSTAGKPGLELGAVADIGITKNIFFQPGIFYEMTGCRLNAGDVNSAGQWDINTIAIPVNFEYKTGHKGGNRFFAGIGPYVGYNISASYNYEAGANYNASSGSLKIGNKRPDPHTGASGDDIRPLDLGLGVNIGYQLANGLYARVHYQQGFTNLDPYSDAYNSYKTMAYCISVGYFFKTEKGHKSAAAKK